MDAMEKYSSIPCFLKKVMKEQKAKPKGNLGHLVIAVHAVFLEAGFVLCDGKQFCLPEGWSSSSPPDKAVSVHYTVPSLVGLTHGREKKVVILKFSVLGSFVLVLGYLNGDDQNSDVYRACLNLGELAFSLISSFTTMSDKDEKKILELWKVVKARLSYPLLIDICEMNRLPLPSCFMTLPADLKMKILEFLPGVDVASIGCTCSELRTLSSTLEADQE